QQALRGGSLESGEHVPGSGDQAEQQVNAVEQLGVFLGDGELKGKIEQALEEALFSRQVCCLQNMRCFRHIPSSNFRCGPIRWLSSIFAPKRGSEKSLGGLRLPHPRRRCAKYAGARSGSCIEAVLWA